MANATCRTINGVDGLLMTSSMTAQFQHFVWTDKNHNTHIWHIITNVDDTEHHIKLLKEQNKLLQNELDATKTKCEKLKEKVYKYKPYYDEVKRIPKKPQKRGPQKIMNKNKEISCCIVDRSYHEAESKKMYNMNKIKNKDKKGLKMRNITRKENNNDNTVESISSRLMNIMGKDFIANAGNQASHISIPIDLIKRIVANDSFGKEEYESKGAENNEYSKLFKRYCQVVQERNQVIEARDKGANQIVSLYDEKEKIQQKLDELKSSNENNKATIDNSIPK